MDPNHCPSVAQADWSEVPASLSPRQIGEKRLETET